MSLYAIGPDLLSLNKMASMSVGTASDDTPISRLTNGIAAQWVQALETGAAFAVDLGGAKTPDLMAVFNHNISGVADVYVEGASNAGFTTDVITLAATIATPNFWRDLRGFAAARRYWRLRVVGNTVAVRVGELVFATVQSFQTHQWDFKDATAYPEIGSVNDFGVMSRVKLGFAVRNREMTFIGGRAMVAHLRRIFRGLGMEPGPCVFVPVDGEADVRLIQGIETLQSEWEVEGRIKVTVLVEEQSPGVGA